MPSEKILEQKKQAVAELSAHLKESCVGVIVNYSGINVADDTKLRKELREAGDTYVVVKNTLLSRALKDAGIEGLDSVLEGTTAIAYNKEDYVSAAKILQICRGSQEFYNQSRFYRWQRCRCKCC